MLNSKTVKIYIRSSTEPKEFTLAAYSKNASVSKYIGVLISPQPDLLPDVFCLMVRIFRLMLVLLYIYIYI